MASSTLDAGVAEKKGKTFGSLARERDDAIGKMTMSRSNVFILGEMLKGEAEKQMHNNSSKTGLPVVAETKPENAEPGAIGLPARQLLSAMYHIERHKRLGEVLVFFGLFAVFIAIAFQLYDVGAAYKSNTAIEDLFLDEEIPGAPFKKNFYEIMTQAEIFEWLKGPLLGGAYPEESYNGKPLDLKDQQYILGYYRLVGGIRLRQARVTNTSCNGRRLLQLCKNRPDALNRVSRNGGDSECIGRFDNLDGTCFSEFVSSTDTFTLQQVTEDTLPFVRNGHVYRWRNDLGFLDGLYGWFQSYGYGGYTVELPTDVANATAMINQLESDLFLDRASRALEVAMNLYNTNTRLLTVVRVMFEMMPTGHIVRWARIYSVPVLQYRSASDRIRAVFEVIFVLFILYYVQKGLRRIRRDHVGGINVLRAMVRPNTLFELILATLAVIMVFQWFRFITSQRIAEFDVNEAHYVEMYDQAESFILTLSWAGMVGLGASFRLFQFLSISKRMNTMWLTIKQGIMDLLAFGVSFGLVIAGFSLWGEMSFGFFLKDFRTFFSSASALARFTLGTWDYEQLRVARPAFAGVFFSLYSALMTISLLNMIIGIIETSFSEVLDIVETADRWKENTQPVEASVIERCRVGASICCRRSFGRGLMPGDSDVRMERVIAARDRFNAALHLCMRKAKKEGTDLFSHFDDVYDEADKDDALYISWHEMASLLYKGQLYSPTALYCRGSTRQAEGSGETVDPSGSGTATIANPILGTAAGAAAGAAAGGAAGGATGAGGVGTAMQVSAAELEASRAASSKAPLDELIQSLKEEIDAQTMTKADCTVVFDRSIGDVAAEECGPCVFRTLLPCCTTGSVSNGRRTGLCFWLCGGTPETSTAGMRGHKAKVSGASRRSSGRASTSQGSADADRATWKELRQLMKAYIDLRKVFFVPAARKHLRAKEEQDARKEAPITVVRRVNGREILRKLAIDDQRSELLSFDSHDNLRRRLPLTKLVAVETAGIEETSLSLVFTSHGVPSAHEAKFGGLEMVFDAKFASEEQRSRFYLELIRVAGKLHNNMLKVTHLMVQEPARAAMLLSKQGVQSPQVQVSHFSARARSAKRMHEVSSPPSTASVTMYAAGAFKRGGKSSKGASTLRKAMTAGPGSLAAQVRKAASSNRALGQVRAAEEAAPTPSGAAGATSGADPDAKEAPLTMFG